MYNLNNASCSLHRIKFYEFIELASSFEQNSLIDFVKIKCFHNSLYCRSAVIQSFTKTVSLLTFSHLISFRRELGLPPLASSQEESELRAALTAKLNSILHGERACSFTPCLAKNIVSMRWCFVLIHASQTHLLRA